MQNIQIGIREAKIHLSKFLKMVQQGNEVILTDRGRPVGKIVPIKTKDLPISARLKELEDMGLLEVISGRYKKELPSPIPVPDNIAQAFLGEDRENG
ncbi:MAG: type II toxin-antitoxin system Phd/YefM family antitoxin [Deltaproteobacteria bacterium]|nr:type II toxin-antitoxin system Phd/YefM family antitoxin [Deltaproteobacteria bacterium]